MTLKVGDRVPAATFHIRTKDGLGEMTSDDVFAGKKVVVFAVPGAFTRTCHAMHVPNYLGNLDAFSDKGVDTVACISVNDAFVMDEWAKQTTAAGKILFLADGNADFTKAAGLEFDGSAKGFGIRSKRYAMLVDDGVVQAINVEDETGVVDASSAENILAAL